MPPSAETQEPQLYHLFRTLFEEAETLVIQEVALVRAEVTESIDHLVKGSAVLLVGIEIAVAGIVILIAALIILVSQTMPLWLACALIGAATLAVAVSLILWGRHSIANAPIVPRRGWRALRETASWAEDELT